MGSMLSTSSRNTGTDSPHETLSVSTLDNSTEDEVNLEVSTEELELDIDNKLAEIMSGVHSLELQQQTEPLPLQKPPRGIPLDRKRQQTGGVYAGVANPKRTPDLVLDLPRETTTVVNPRDVTFPLPVAGQQEDSPTLTTAEVFAKSNQCTIKKGTTLNMPRHGPISASAKNGNSVPMNVHGHVDEISASMKRSTSSNTGTITSTISNTGTIANTSSNITVRRVSLRNLRSVVISSTHGILPGTLVELCLALALRGGAVVEAEDAGYEA